MRSAGNRVYPIYVDTSGGDLDIYTNVIVFPSNGDINGDGMVDPQDLAILLGNWGPCPGCPADLDGDGVVGPLDLATLLGNWG